MALKGIRKLQTAAVILYGAAFLLFWVVVLFQRQFARLYSYDSEVLNQWVFPWMSFVPLVVSLLVSILFLVLCFSLKTAKGSRVSVIVLLIAPFVFSYLVMPVVNRVYTQVLNHYSSNAYLASYSIVINVVSLSVSPLLLAGSLLMGMAMGGFYGINPSGQESRGAVTLKGARILQVVSVCLLGLALVLILALTAGQDRVIRLFGAPDDLTRYRTVPWDTLISLALIAVPAVIWLAALFKGRGTARGVVILAAILFGVLSLVCFFLSIAVTVIYSRLYDSYTVASYSILRYAVEILTDPLSGAAVTLMLFSLGGYYGKQLPSGKELP